MEEEDIASNVPSPAIRKKPALIHEGSSSIMDENGEHISNHSNTNVQNSNTNVQNSNTNVQNSNPSGVTSMVYGGVQIDRLDGVSNFTSWKFQMRMALTLEGLWPCIDGTVDDAARDQRALARICLGVKPCCFQYVRDAKTSKEAWLKLSTVFEDKGLYRRVLLLRQLHRVDFSSYTSMTNYIEAVMNLVHQLESIGKTVDDEEVAELLLSSLPQDYDALVSNLETACMAKKLSSELVRTRLLQEELRKASLCENVPVAGSAFVSRDGSKRLIICNYCKRPGHISAKCYRRKRDSKNKENKTSTFFAPAFLAHDQGWYIDSGASTHMCNNKDLFHKLNKCNSHHKITIANDTQLQCEGVGEIELNTAVRKINDVYFVPKLSANLLSVSKLVQMGLTVTFNREGCFIFRECRVLGQPVASATNNRGIYKLDQNSECNFSHQVHSTLLCPRQEQQNVTDAAVPKLPIEIWHKRLGHLNFNDMKVLQNGAAHGVCFQNDNQQQLRECVACFEGKMSAKPYPVGKARRATQPLQLIHSDVCGPMPEASWGRRKVLLPSLMTLQENLLDT
ncbi:hypothetical protein MSG28_001854 [Choristoneura fumiferana]|uniref:Uncharacterized protein n=1 Tax=Choristoneura fumiferana TaxID=7141 RepID=A0ACC0KWI7_CHOFU|nr:hypothetical protein MSG28_001854 [Choristoneura fumiferana]